MASRWGMRMSSALDTIRRACADREWTPRDLARESLINYSVAWQLLRGDSSRIDWATLDHTLSALGMHLTRA